MRRPRVRLGAGSRRAPGVRRRRGSCHRGAGGRRKGKLGGLRGGHVRDVPRGVIHERGAHR
eukprot:1810918-Alexandrium_andersonii.AAC.1